MVQKILLRLFPKELATHQKFSPFSSTFGTRIKVYQELSSYVFMPIFLPEKTIMLIRKSITNVYVSFFSSSPESLNKCKEMFNELLRNYSANDEIETKDEEESDSTITTKRMYVDTDDNEVYSSTTRHIEVKSFSEILLSEENKNKLITYLSKWTNAQTLFSKLGINHQLGILLYGAPGTGKTSVAKAIALYLKRDLCILPCIDFPAHLPSFDGLSGKILLMEDIDQLFNSESLVLNSFLQFLDGVGSVENFIIICTTNHIERLSDATIRDGRFDLKLHLDNFQTYKEAEDMCKTLTLSKEETDKLLNKHRLPINPAQLQNECIQLLFKSMGDNIEEGVIQ